MCGCSRSAIGPWRCRRGRAWRGGAGGGVPPRKGRAGVAGIGGSQPHHGTRLGAAVEYVSKLPMDRLIVITDEQAHDEVGTGPTGKFGYMLNVASYQNGVGFGKWVRINGFSEQVIRFITEFEVEGWA